MLSLRVSAENSAIPGNTTTSQAPPQMYFASVSQGLKSAPNVPHIFILHRSKTLPSPLTESYLAGNHNVFNVTSNTNTKINLRMYLTVVSSVIE